MIKVVFRKHPLNTNVQVGGTLNLLIKTLSGHLPTVLWECNTGEGWKEVGTGKMLEITNVTEADSGDYRCSVNGLCSRIAKVSVGDFTASKLKEALKGTDEAPLEIPTKENDVFIEILEGTGEDASEELIEKVSKAIREDFPEVLKD